MKQNSIKTFVPFRQRNWHHVRRGWLHCLNFRLLLPERAYLHCSCLRSCRGCCRTHSSPAHSWFRQSRADRRRCSCPGQCLCTWHRWHMACGWCSSWGPGHRRDPPSPPDSYTAMADCMSRGGSLGNAHTPYRRGPASPYDMYSPPGPHSSHVSHCSPLSRWLRRRRRVCYYNRKAFTCMHAHIQTA